MGVQIGLEAYDTQPSVWSHSRRQVLRAATALGRARRRSGTGPGGEPPTGGLATKSYHVGQKSARVEGICTTAREAIRTCCTFPA